MDQGTPPDAAKRVIPEDTMNKTNETSLTAERIRMFFDQLLEDEEIAEEAVLNDGSGCAWETQVAFAEPPKDETEDESPAVTTFLSMQAWNARVVMEELEREPIRLAKIIGRIQLPPSASRPPPSKRRDHVAKKPRINRAQTRINF
ncbi:MAG: hypothetical protein Q8P12_01535 [bacterium]|nr:hypothetical protein [bacterium]